MDLSPEHAQMCRQAKEIQEQWKKEAGDWIVTPEGIRVLSSKVIQIKGEETSNILKYAIPKRMTLASPILNSDPRGALERSIDYVDFDMYPSEYCWWLPRQDQLQAILNGNYPACNFCTLDILFKFVNKNEWLERRSMEQVWIAFVMSQKYGKKWDLDTKDWVAE